MKKFFTAFFVVLGVIFFCILIFLAYFWIADPYNIKPFIFNDAPPMAAKETARESAASETGVAAEGTADVASPSLSPAQESALKAVGITPEAIPQSFTPAQLACFEGIFGTARVAEIKAGSAPTFAEFSSGQKCL